MISFEMSSSSSPIDSVGVVSGSTTAAASISSSPSSSSSTSSVQSLESPLSTSSHSEINVDINSSIISSSSSSTKEANNNNNKLLLNKMFENFAAVSGNVRNDDDEIVADNVRDNDDCASDGMEYFLESPSPLSPNSSSSSSSSNSLLQDSTTAVNPTSSSSSSMVVCENSENICQQESSASATTTTTTFFSPFKSPKNHRCPLNSKIDDLMTSPILNSGVKRESIFSTTLNDCGIVDLKSKVITNDLFHHNSPIEQCRKPSPLINDSMNSSGPILSPSQPKITNWFSSRIQTPTSTTTNNSNNNKNGNCSDNGSITTSETLSRSMRIFNAAKKSMNFTVSNSDCDLNESNSQPITTTTTTDSSFLKSVSNSQPINHRLKRALSYQESPTGSSSGLTSSSSPSSHYRKTSIGPGRTSPFLSRGSECLKALNKDLKTTLSSSSLSVSVYPIFTGVDSHDSFSENISSPSKPLSSVENTELNELSTSSSLSSSSSTSTSSSTADINKSNTIVGILRKTPPSTPLSSSSVKKRKAVIFTDPVVSSKGYFDTASTKVVSIYSPKAAKRHKLDLTTEDSNDSLFDDNDDAQIMMNQEPESEKNVECIRLRSRRVSRNCINLFKSGFNREGDDNNKDNNKDNDDSGAKESTELSISSSSKACDTSVSNTEEVDFKKDLTETTNSELQQQQQKEPETEEETVVDKMVEVTSNDDADSSKLETKLDNLQSELNELNSQLIKSNDDLVENRQEPTTEVEEGQQKEEEEEPMQIEDSFEEISGTQEEANDEKPESEVAVDIVEKELTTETKEEKQTESSISYPDTLLDEASFVLVPESPVNDEIEDDETMKLNEISEDDKIEEISESSQDDDDNDLPKSSESSAAVSSTSGTTTTPTVVMVSSSQTTTPTTINSSTSNITSGISICNSAYLPRSLSMLKAAKQNSKVSRVFVETLRFAESPTKSSTSSSSLSSTELQNNSGIISSSSSQSPLRHGASSQLNTSSAASPATTSTSSQQLNNNNSKKSPSLNSSCLTSLRRGSAFLQAAKIKQAEKLSSHQQQLVDQSESIQITTENCGSATEFSTPKSILKVVSKVTSERKKVIFSEPVVSRQLFFDSSISSLFTCDKQQQPHPPSSSSSLKLSSSATTTTGSTLSQDQSSSFARLKLDSLTDIDNNDNDASLRLSTTSTSTGGDDERLNTNSADNGLDIHHSNGSSHVVVPKRTRSGRRIKTRRNRLFHQNSTFEYCDNFVIVQSNAATTTTTATPSISSSNIIDNNNTTNQSVVSTTTNMMTVDDDEVFDNNGGGGNMDNCDESTNKQDKQQINNDSVSAQQDDDDESTISIDIDLISSSEEEHSSANQQQTSVISSKDKKIDNSNSSLFAFGDSLMKDDDDDDEEQTVYCSMSYKKFNLDQMEDTDNTDEIEWNVEEIVDSEHVEAKFSDDEDDSEVKISTETNEETMEVTESDQLTATQAVSNNVSSTPSSSGSAGSSKSYSSSQDYSEQAFSIYTQQFPTTTTTAKLSSKTVCPDQTSSTLLDDESSSLFDRLISSEDFESESTVTTSRCGGAGSNSSSSGGSTTESTVETLPNDDGVKTTIQKKEESMSDKSSTTQTETAVPAVKPVSTSAPPSVAASVSIVSESTLPVSAPTTAAELSNNGENDDNEFVYIRMPLGLAKQFYHYFGQVFSDPKPPTPNGNPINDNCGT